MEIFLNLAWAAVSLVLVSLWFRYGNTENMSRRRQIVALAILIAILLPVISVSDDLMAMQNATETDTCLRRDQFLPAHAHTLLPFVAVLTPAFFDALHLGPLGRMAPHALPTVSRLQPEIPALQNRPPPAA